MCHQQVSLKGSEQEKRVLVPWKNAEVLLPVMANVEVLPLSEEWDGILQRIDQSLKEDDTGVELGDTVPEQISDSGGWAIVVSFGDQKGAQQWLVKTSCPFPMLLDSQRKVWGVEEMVYYAESMAKNIPLPNPSQYVNDDPQQVDKVLEIKPKMGGDFIIDKDGVVQYMYCSKKSIDRPSVQDILDNLKVCCVCLNCNLLFVQFNQ
uniref:Uncharacterized protein n=1 Tax=Magallana gigas TaxID=29159 RepID=K1PYT0_MAGGI